MRRHEEQREAESQFIFSPPCSPMGSPTRPKTRWVANPVNHWRPSFPPWAPRYPSAIRFRHRGHFFMIHGRVVQPRRGSGVGLAAKRPIFTHPVAPSGSGNPCLTASPPPRPPPSGGRWTPTGWRPPWARGNRTRPTRHVSSRPPVVAEIRSLSAPSRRFRRAVPKPAALNAQGAVSPASGPDRGRIVGSEWTKREAADEAATTEARAKCTTRCARTVARRPRSRSSRTRPDPSTAEIVSPSAGRDGSKIRTARAFEPSFARAPNRRAAGAELAFPYPHARVRTSPRREAR